MVGCTWIVDQEPIGFPWVLTIGAPVLRGQHYIRSTPLKDMVLH